MAFRLVLALAMLGAALPAGAGTRVRVGMYENEPLVFTGADGRPRGICIDTLQHVAAAEGWELDYVRGSWPECFERLEQGEIDLLVAIAYSAARTERFDFNDELVLANWGQVYARENRAIESVLDLQGKTVALLEDDIYNEAFRELLGRFGVEARFVEMAGYRAVLDAVAEGHADAGVVSRLFAARQDTAHPLRRSPIIFSPIELRFAAPKGRGAELLAALDTHLRELKRDKGSVYHRSLDRWLGAPPPEPSWPGWLPWGIGLGVALLVAVLVANAMLGATVRRRTAQLRARNLELVEQIAERKRAEEDLRREAHLRTTLIEASPAFIVAIDAEGKTVMMNESMLVALGYHHDEAIGTDYLATFVPEADRELLSRVFHRLVDLKAPALNRNRVVAKDGRELLVEWHGRPVLDDRDEIEFFFGVGIDLTRRKEAEQALEQLADRLSTLRDIDQSILAAQSPEAIAAAALDRLQDVVPCWRCSVVEFDHDRDRATILAARAGAETTLGRGEHFPIADFGDVAPLRRGELRASPDLADLDGPSPVDAVLRDEGLRAYVNLPMVSEGELVGSLDLGSDQPGAFDPEQLDIAREVADVLAISIRQARLHEQARRHAAELEARVAERTAELREVNAELETFAFSVSHDLRAPLRAMEGFGEALLEDYGDRLDGEGRDYAESIADAARRMDLLIQDLLAYSRVRRSEMPLGVTRLELAVEEAQMQIGAAAEAARAEIRLEPPLPAVRGHHATLVQAVANLLGNAIKFVAPGTRPKIRVRAETREDRVRLWVEDNGIGIAAEHHGRVFTVFERLHSPDHYPGTGIGLAIVRRGIERMGGEVGVESAEGQGSRFWIDLPQADDPT